MPGNTQTGQVLESMVLPALRFGGYDTKVQVRIGSRPSGTNHIVDVLATKDDKHYLISLKWQQVSGTAEQKVPYEVICLVDAVTKGVSKYKHDYEKAYLVLGGEGWRLRDFFINELDDYLLHSTSVEIMKLETFIAIANYGNL